MAKNFGKAGNALMFETVGKKAAEKAQVAVIQNISSLNLMDNPKNGEDITHTEDLELSIMENGFTDPIEVTDFGMDSGKYMILSGHRRRAAGVKTGMLVFPAIIRHFNNENDMVNYMLLSNSQRDSAKDPFLFSRRYKLHEQYLIDSGFKGNKREEIARRLGLSVQQADRYNAMNKIIFPVWDLVYAEKVGMSSVLPMASHSETEQNEIYTIMSDALKDGVVLTREFVKKLIDDYRSGKKTWIEINEVPSAYETPVKGGIEEEIINRNDEVSKEQDIISEESDKADEEQKIWEKTHECVTRDDFGKKQSDSSEEVDTDNKMKTADDIMKSLQRLEEKLTEIYHCKDADAGHEMLNVMGKVAETLIGEMFNLSEEYGWKDDFQKNAGIIKEILDNYS